MNNHYTSEKHTQILIALLKFHGIKKIVASPGTMNICLVASLQNDSFFEMYSSVDERSAAFIACGLAAESGEPVALSCTESNASRNYISGLTEAYYRKLPILAITAQHHPGRVGTGYSQVIDRSHQLKDMVMESVQIGPVYTKEDEWACGLSINKALIALRKNGGGPAHINWITTCNRDFSVKELPSVRGIHYYDYTSKLPSLDKHMRIAILVGNHSKWSSGLLKAVDTFCDMYNAVVLMNHACNYKGDYGVNHAIILSMKNYDSTLKNADLILYIGSTPRYISGMKKNKSEMWRINPDGIIRDPEKLLTGIFAMEEIDFFNYYISLNPLRGQSKNDNYAKLWQTEYESIISKIPELPFSNVWIAKNTIEKIPNKSVLHIAGSNTSRAWNFFKLPKTVTCYSNDGVMGIDGQVSALIGESLANPNQLYFGVVGDLTFFYDMNSIGNRHIGNNIRLIIVNNGMGAEFRIYSHPAFQFGEDGKKFIAAGGHYGNQSRDLIRHYAQDLGFEYLCANSKEEYLNNIDIFLNPNPIEKSIIFEVFTEAENESDAIYIMNHLVQNSKGVTKDFAKNTLKSIVGDKGVSTMKKILKID